MITILKKYIKSISGTGVSISGSTFHPLNFPSIIHLENTNACPARCTICSMDQMGRKVGTMDFELFETLIRECARHTEVGEVHLHGFGEPLMDKALPRKIQLAKQLGILNTYIVTNAFLLTEKMAYELILAGLDTIKFSFYGMTKDSYEAIHRGLIFEKTVRNIEIFFKVRDQLKALTPSVRLQFSLGLAPPGEFDLFIQKWQPYMDSDRNDCFYITGLHNWAGAKDYAEISSSEQNRYCAWPFRDIQILWDGRVVPCVFDYDGKMVLGDTRQETIEQIWSSEGFKNFRDIWLKGKSFSLPLCARCNEPEGGYRPHRCEPSVQPVSRGIVNKNIKYFMDIFRKFKFNMGNYKLNLFN